MKHSLFEKIQKVISEAVNEEFDFGSVDIDSSAADNMLSGRDTVREIINKPSDMPEVFLTVFGMNIPSGFAKTSHTLPKFGRIWHRPKAWDIFSGAKSCRSTDILMKADRDSLQKSPDWEYCSYTVYKDRPKNDCPEFLRALLTALGWDMRSEKFSIKCSYWLSPDQGVCVIYKCIMQCYDGGACSPTGKLYTVYPSMIFYTGDVIYNPDKKLSKDKDKELKLLKKVNLFLRNLNNSSTYRLCDMDSFTAELMEDGKTPVWVMHNDFNKTYMYVPRKGIEFDKLMAGTEPESAIGQIQFYYKAGSQYNTYQIVGNPKFDYMNNIVDFHAASDVLEYHIMSDYDAVKKMIGQKAFDKATEMYITTTYRDDEPLYKVKVFLTVTPKYRKVFDDFMSKKITPKQLYLRDYQV